MMGWCNMKYTACAVSKSLCLWKVLIKHEVCVCVCVFTPTKWKRFCQVQHVSCSGFTV